MKLVSISSTKCLPRFKSSCEHSLSKSFPSSNTSCLPLLCCQNIGTVHLRGTSHNCPDSKVGHPTNHLYSKMNGQHTTTLHETTAPAVIQQTHFKARHEVITDAVDREVHQVHYHTSVQPVHDVQELTQEHIHRVTDVQHSEVDHGDDEADRLRLLRDADNYKNSYKTADPKYFRTENPKVIGEHVHHHVYEIVRPVINREVRQLRVVHTTRPSREIIREQARHHNIKTLPALSITDFQRLSGDVLNQGDKEWTISGAPTTEHFGPSFIRGSKNGQGSAAPGAKALDRPSRDSSRSSSSSSSSRSSVSSRQSNRVAGTRDKFENMSRRNEATR